MRGRVAQLAAIAIAVAALATVVAVSALAPIETARVESFQRSADPRTIVVNVLVGLGDEIVAHSAREDSRTVTVTVRHRVNTRVRLLLGVLLPVAVTLREPLGDRTVLDPSGLPVRDLGDYQGPREPPIDYREIGLVEDGSFRVTNDVVDFRWKDFKGQSGSLADLRGSMVVILSRTAHSDEAKMSLHAVEERLGSLTPAERGRVVLLVITLGDDPLSAAVGRPSDSFLPLLARPSAIGRETPEIFALGALPTTWFVGPDGVVRHRVVRGVLSSDDVLRGLAAAAR